jgi:choline dehydrogenase
MNFDYIIVGAGSAGAVIANRLSSNSNTNVLLIEAGPKDINPAIHMPAGVAEVLKSKRLNWQFWSKPQKMMNNRSMYTPRGKMLGGSSGINGMVYIRGHASDYDEWSAEGNEGWSYDDVLPYFKQSENQERGASHYHGVNGELSVQNTRSPNILFDTFIKACISEGIKENSDFNGEDQEGDGRLQCTMKNHKRHSTAAAFLHPIMKKRTNLTVLTHTHVTSVLLDGNRAIGVQASYKNSKVLKTFYANNEVILSAGTIHSPVILQHSGIGRREDLEKANIQCKLSLPGVGYNLQEHLDLWMHYECSSELSFNKVGVITKKIQTLFEYLVFKRGIGASIGFEAAAFIKTLPELSKPDVQIHFVPLYITSIIGDIPKRSGITLHACNLRPHSRGSVTVTSNNPFDAPDIEYNFLDNEHDLNVLTRAYKICRNILTSQTWGGLLGSPIGDYSDAQTDSEIHDAIRKKAEAVYHPVGTCKMGRDDMAVVDDQLCVRGIEGLRVADASIMPTIVGGNTNAPAIMIGEKCAAMIQKKHNKSCRT